MDTIFSPDTDSVAEIGLALSIAALADRLIGLDVPTEAEDRP